MSQIKVPTIQLLVRTLFLTYRQPPSCCVFIWQRERVNSLMSLLTDINPIRLRPHSLTLFNLNYLFKGPISKFSCILSCWGLPLRHMNVEGGHTIQSLTVH